MNVDDIVTLSKIFENPDPASVMGKLNSMTKEERKSAAELCFELQGKIFSSILDDSINETFLKIHRNMENMFFQRIFRASQKIQSKSTFWCDKLSELRGIELFSNISDFDLMIIADSVREVELIADEPFISRYKPVTGVFLLKEPANVYEFTSKIPVISRNGIFGDDACVTGSLESSITVKPTVNCTALFISRQDFNKLIRSVPGLQERVFQSVVDRAKQGSVRAEEQRRLTQEILDNIGQGSFSINVAGEIGENYTAIASEYLGLEDLSGVPFADLAFSGNRDVLKDYYRALHLLFSGNEFEHQVVLDLLPKEATINNRFFKLHYSFVQDGANHVTSVFVRMEDMTLEWELSRKEERERLIAAKMQKDIGGFMDMLENMGESYDMIERFAEEYWVEGNQPGGEEIAGIMRTLHGSKGLCGQFELDDLKGVIHDLEEWFSRVDHEGISACSDAFKDLYVEFEKNYQFAMSFKENLGEGIIRILNGVSFSQDQYRELETIARSGNHDQLAALILEKNKVPADRIIVNWEKDALKLARRLRKNVSLHAEVEPTLKVPKEMASSLNVGLGHLYRNSIDHGIESPSVRRESGKNAVGRIDVRIRKENGELVFSLTDDGKGIDNEKIVEIARKNADLDQAIVNRYVDNGEIWRILFLRGFSSRSEATDISGRGVGMDAVMESVRELKGDLEMSSGQGEGCSIQIRIPLD